MKLVVWMLDDGVTNPEGQVNAELLAVESDGITMDSVRELAEWLRVAMAHLTVTEPTLSNEERTVNIQIGSQISSQHVQTAKNSIRQIIAEELRHKGVVVPIR